MVLPKNISTGRVTGQFIVGVIDGADADAEPEFIPARGRVAFTASIPYLPIPAGASNPVTVLNTTLVGVLDDEGYLCTPDAADPSKPARVDPLSEASPTQRGVRLVATDDPGSLVQGWTWKATPRFESVNGASLQSVVPTFDFALFAGTDVDLTTVVKVPASQGVGTAQAEALAASALAAAESAASDVGDALAAAESAEESARAANEALVATSEALLELGTNTSEAVEREIVTPGTLGRNAVEAVAGQATFTALTTEGLAKTAVEATVSRITQEITGPLSDTLGQVPTQIDNAVQPVAKAVATAADPLAYLNSIDILCSWETRPAGAEEAYPQAININEAAGEIYVSNQGGTLLRIDVRNLDGTKKSSRSITTDNGAYTQALPYFYNTAGDLCFMIRPGVGADPNTGVFSYAIYNYTKNTLGPRIPIKGHNLADVQGDKYVTAEAGNNNIRSFYVYDWESVKNGSPQLVASIPVPGDKTSAAKNQGMVSSGGYFFLLQGAAGTNPTISVYDMTGALVTIHEYSAADFGEAMNRIQPRTVTNADYTYENEGGCKYQGRLATLDVINNTTAIADSRTYVVLHNIVGGSAIPVGMRSVVQDTGWKEMPLNSPFVEWATTQKPAVRRSGSMCMFRGAVKGLPGAPASNILLNVPAEFRPPVDRQFAQMSSSGYTANWQLGANGDLKLLITRDAAPSASTWYPLPTEPWFND